MLVKLLCKFIKKGQKHGSGRNFKGRITVRSRCSFLYSKKPVLAIDFAQKFTDLSFVVVNIYHSQFRTSFISFIYYYSFGIFSQILSSNAHYLGAVGLNISQNVVKYNNEFSDCNFFNSAFIGCFPLGSKLFNIESFPGSGGIFVRSAGSYAILTSRLKLFTNSKEFFGVVLPSKILIYLSYYCKGCFGLTSNSLFSSYNRRSAGSMYLRNRRSSVRGVAKNPIDHPHGGGEGKTSGGRISVTPWGILTKGFKTLKYKKKKSRLMFLTKFRKKTVILP